MTEIPDPLSDIENEKAQRDIGIFISRVYRGALADGCSRWDAFWTAAAFVAGTFKANDLPTPEDEDE